MSLIDKKFMESVISAYKTLKGRPDMNCYLEPRNNDMRYIDFILERGNLDYGQDYYCAYSRNVYVCEFTGAYLESLIQPIPTKESKDEQT